MKKKISYKDSGVHVQKAEKLITSFLSMKKQKKHQSLLQKNILSGIGPFAAALRLKPILTNYTDPVLVTSCDGVGTKVLLGRKHNYLTGLGQDLLAMNVNDLLCLGAKPLLFLDYFSTAKLDGKTYLAVLQSLEKACRAIDVELVGGETAELKGIIQENEFDIAGFVIGICERAQMLGSFRVTIGDHILGLRSNGLHSNGFSLIHALLHQNKLNLKKKLASREALLEWLMRPTTIYHTKLFPKVSLFHALCHITGGGIMGNLPRVLQSHQYADLEIKKDSIPEGFHMIQKASQLTFQEMFSVFNCGIGMIAILNEKNISPSLLKSLKDFDPIFLGTIRRKKNHLTGSKVSITFV